MNDIIHKYLQGEATGEEKRELLHWLKQSEENKKLFSELRDIWLASGKSPLAGPDYSRRAFRRFENEIEAGERKQKQIRFSRILQVAASVAVLIVCSLGGYFVGHTDYVARQSNSEQVILNQVIMGKDSKGNVTLPDGTLVWLNADSKLLYPEKFSSASRRVKLEGEGYFEVVRNEQAPFYVETNGMVVNVLGTRFDVKNYEAKNTVETVLLTGKVEVCFPGTDKSILLKPNEKIICDKQTGTYKLSQVRAADYILWINDKLVCTNETLAMVIHKMKRWYGLDIVCGKGVPMEQRLSLTIRRETPEEVFKLLEMIVPIEYKIEADRIIVSTKNIKKQKK